MRVTKAYTANMETLQAGGFDDIIEKGIKAKKYDFETTADVIKAAKTGIDKSTIYKRCMTVRSKISKKDSPEALTTD